MEKLLAKLKTNSLITLILAILSLTWLLIDYFVVKQIVSENNISLGYEWVLLVISLVAMIIFHISVFVTLFYIFRTSLKYKSELKMKDKESAEKAEDNTVEQQDAIK